MNQYLNDKGKHAAEASKRQQSANLLKASTATAASQTIINKEYSRSNNRYEKLHNSSVAAKDSATRLAVRLGPPLRCVQLRLELHFFRDAHREEDHQDAPQRKDGDGQRDEEDDCGAVARVDDTHDARPAKIRACGEPI